MNLVRFGLRLLLGQRLPTVVGDLSVPGLVGPVVIRRDQFGVPHIEAESDADAWFGLGFCHGQDRAFQLETLLRLARGTLAELLGREALGVDRVSRRVGFYRAAQKQIAVQHADALAVMTAYANGVSMGATRGMAKPAHEFALLKSEPTSWTARDVLAVLNLQSFLLPSNWDVELARLKILLADGPEAGLDCISLSTGGGAAPLAARVERVEPVAFTKVSALGVEEQRVNIIADISSPRATWKGLGDGFKVDVRLLVQVEEGALMVPVSALFPIGSRSGVFILDGGHVRLQEVTVQARNGAQAWVPKGLALNTQVVVYPDIKLKDGAKVKARPQTTLSQ